MRSASRAAVLILVSAWFLARIGTYSGSKSSSMLTPSLLLGRSMMWPFEASTVKPRPRNLVKVRDLVGDSTITSDFADPRAAPSPFRVAALGPGAVLALSRLALPGARRPGRPSVGAPAEAARVGFRDAAFRDTAALAGTALDLDVAFFLVDKIDVSVVSLTATRS